jgi:methoxymalonate biosynthesis acyl carrier protein
VTTTSHHPDRTAIAAALLGFLAARLRTDVAADADLFASGLVNSMFAMELVVHLETTFDVMIEGTDLKLDNFRTIWSMTDLVSRLASARAAVGDD